MEAGALCRHPLLPGHVLAPLLPPEALERLRQGIRDLAAGRLLAVAGASPGAAAVPVHASRATARGVGSSTAGGPDSDDVRVEALVELAKGGSAEAFGALYERYVDVVYRYVYVRVGSRPLAEDLTSETFLRALRRLDSFTWQGRDLGAWLVTIARNLVVDHVRSSRYRLEVATSELVAVAGADEGAGPETRALQRLRDEALVGAMKALRPDQAECLVLRFFDGLSLAETAKVLGRSEGAVKQLQLRAVRALARELGGEVP